MKDKGYQAGDFVGVLGGAISHASYAIFTPPTRLFHFLDIGDYIPEEDDHEILEAIASGVRTGRLSWYKNDLYVVFRLNDPDAKEIGQSGHRIASKFGRWGYDYGMYGHLLIDLIRIYSRILVREHHLRRIRPEELPYHENHAFVCTEFENATKREVKHPIIPPGVNPFPAGYVQAYLDGKIKVVGVNIPEKYRQIDFAKLILPPLPRGRDP